MATPKLKARGKGIASKHPSKCVEKLDCHLSVDLRKTIETFSGKCVRPDTALEVVPLFNRDLWSPRFLTCLCLLALITRLCGVYWHVLIKVKSTNSIRKRSNYFGIEGGNSRFCSIFRLWHHSGNLGKCSARNCGKNHRKAPFVLCILSVICLALGSTWLAPCYNNN